MLERKPIFPNVIEMNFQAGHVIGCNVYLVFDREDWLLIDTGYEEDVDEIVELIRQMDFPLSQCRLLIATHADVDHAQGMSKAKQRLRVEVAAHPRAAQAFESGDRLYTLAEIAAQGVSYDMPPVPVERRLTEGDVVHVGDVKLEIWETPGHTDSQLAFRCGELLFSGDNIYRDGAVGAIDAHHGSDLVAFIKSLRRIRESDVKWLLPSHGPIFRKDDALLDSAIERLEGYLHMADFGTCAIDWPLLDEWEQEIRDGRLPK